MPEDSGEAGVSPVRLNPGGPADPSAWPGRDILEAEALKGGRRRLSGAVSPSRRAARGTEPEPFLKHRRNHGLTRDRVDDNVILWVIVGVDLAWCNSRSIRLRYWRDDCLK